MLETRRSRTIFLRSVVIVPFLVVLSAYPIAKLAGLSPETSPDPVVNLVALSAVAWFGGIFIGLVFAIIALIDWLPRVIFDWRDSGL